MAKAKSPYEAPAPASDKKKALETALQQIEKNFGKGSVMRLGDTPVYECRGHPDGLPGPGPGAGHRRRAPGQNH